jgi:hypothetical protein
MTLVEGAFRLRLRPAHRRRPVHQATHLHPVHQATINTRRRPAHRAAANAYPHHFSHRHCHQCFPLCHPTPRRHCDRHRLAAWATLFPWLRAGVGGGPVPSPICRTCRRSGSGSTRSTLACCLRTASCFRFPRRTGGRRCARCLSTTFARSSSCTTHSGRSSRTSGLRRTSSSSRSWRTGTEASPATLFHLSRCRPRISPTSIPCRHRRRQCATPNAADNPSSCSTWSTKTPSLYFSDRLPPLVQTIPTSSSLVDRRNLLHRLRHRRHRQHRRHRR